MRRGLVVLGVVSATLLSSGLALARAKSHHPKVRAHAAALNCDVYNSYLKLVPSGNNVYAQGQVGAWCSGIDSLFATGYLQEKWLKDGEWHTMGTVGLGKGEPNETLSWAYPKAKCTGSAGRDWRLYGSATIHTGGEIVYKAAKSNPKEAYLSCVA